MLNRQADVNDATRLLVSQKSFKANRQELITQMTVVRLSQDFQLGFPFPLSFCLRVALPQRMRSVMRSRDQKL